MHEWPVRVRGVSLLIVGAIITYLGVYVPIRDVLAGEDEINHYGIAFVIAPMVFVLGAIYSILGDNAEELIGEMQSPNRTGWIPGRLRIKLLGEQDLRQIGIVPGSGQAFVFNSNFRRLFIF